MATRLERFRREFARYLEATRGVTISFAYLLPLLAVYEAGVWLTGLDLRNSAELSMKQFAGTLGPYAVWVELLVLLGSLIVALRLSRRDVPALRLYPYFVGESVLMALLLGPIVSVVVRATGLQAGASGATTGQRVLLSIGAGVYEELLFRFLLLAGGFALLHRGMGLRRGVAFGIALAASALLFAAYHHMGPFGEPFAPVAFAFRTGAGLLLGLLFAGRGLALCAYLHAFYDILCDLHAAGGGAA
jgi:hypothetical protein